MKFKLRPEIKDVLYWVHLLILSIVVLGILQFTRGGEMFTIKNILWSIPLLAVGDIIAHSLVRIN